MKPNRNPLRTLIYTCWALLLICFALKLIGADWFTAYSESETFNNICKFIDTHIWLRQIIAALMCTFTGSLIVLAILQRKFYNSVQFFVFIIGFVTLSYSTWISTTLSFILSFVVYLLPIIWLRKKWYRAIVGIALLNGFQLISLLMKNAGGLNLHNLPFIVSILLQIDTIIMAVLYYLYSNRKEVITNG